MKKLLIIGAGVGQVYLVKKAKDMGCHVIVVTIPGDWPALEFADEVWYMDIYDRDAIVKKASEESIDAVISDQNDLMMPTVAYVAEKLGIPGNRFEQVMSYCNKNNFRNNCDKLGIPVPKHTAVNSIKFDFSKFDCEYPYIVKPADSQSSIGVKKVNNDEELKQALSVALECSKTGEAIVEEFFVGDEVVCEGFVEEGEYHLLEFADRKYFTLENLMIPSQTLFPSDLSDEIKNKIIECEKKMTNYIRPSFAIIHSEYLVDKVSDEIRVVETAVRGGGVFISSHLIPYATGIDINDVLLKKALGVENDVPSLLKDKCNHASGYVCFYLKEGVITSIEGMEEIKALPFVKMAMVNNLKVGMKTEKMEYKGARKGPILVVGSDRKELEENIARVQNALHIIVENNGCQMEGIVWE